MAAADAFRRLALALPDATESSHMGSPDFRRNGRIFATLAFLNQGFGTLKLTPQQQGDFLAEAPDLYSPAPGGWGRMGMTLVRLNAPEPVLSGALQTAHHNLARRPSSRNSPVPRAPEPPRDHPQAIATTRPRRPPR